MLLLEQELIHQLLLFSLWGAIIVQSVWKTLRVRHAERLLERFSYDLKMTTREQNRHKKRTEIERYDWFIERIQTRVAFGLVKRKSNELGWKKLHVRELSRNQPILRFDVILQHNWSIEQCLLHIRVSFGVKTKIPCLDLFIDWLINQKRNTYRNYHFSRSWENRSNKEMTNKRGNHNISRGMAGFEKH